MLFFQMVESIRDLNFKIQIVRSFCHTLDHDRKQDCLVSFGPVFWCSFKLNLSTSNSNHIAQRIVRIPSIAHTMRYMLLIALSPSILQRATESVESKTVLDSSICRPGSTMQSLLRSVQCCRTENQSLISQ